MSFITDWLTNIILLILLATILELLLPNSSMQRYVKMVVGLLLFVVILQPLLSIFTEDVDQWLFSNVSNTESAEWEIEQSINLQKRDIELGQRAYISEQVAVQLENEVEEELRDTYSLDIVQIYIQIDESQIEALSTEELIEHMTAIHVEVKAFEESNEEQEDGERKRQVEPVRVVTIDTTSPNQPEEVEQLPELKPVQRFLSKSWQLSEDIISLSWEGGKRAE